MNMTAILLFLLCLHVSAEGLSQKISLSEHNAPLKKVLNEISRQTGTSIFYDEAIFRKAGPVTITITEGTLEEALGTVLDGNNFAWTIENASIMIRAIDDIKPGVSKKNAPEKIDIRGVVRDNTGAPLPGASVIVKGTQMGTQTDASGEFLLAGVDPPATLQISIIGYKAVEKSVDGKSYIEVTLEPNLQSMNEILVVGYGTQKKVNLTGAVSQISGEELENRPITNVTEGLQGLIANLNIRTTTAGGAPDAEKTINIRGFTGLGSNAAPLILIDGVEGDINSINPVDIESISILKDAASSAIYGSRAPYGVILITTKGGKKNQPIRLSYNGNVSFSEPVNVPETLNSLQFAEIYNEASANAGLPPVFTDEVIARIKAFMADPVNTPSTIPNPGNPLEWGSYGYSNANNNWFDIFLKDRASNQQHTIGLNGGGERIQYYLGLGYLDKSGMFRYFDDKYGRYNFRANISSEVNNWISIGLRTAFSNENSNNPYAGARQGNNWYHNIPRHWPTVPLKNPDGYYSLDSEIPTISEGGRNIRSANASRIMGEIILKPLAGWHITGNYTYSYNSGRARQTILPVAYKLIDGSTAMTETIPFLSKTANSSRYYNYNIFTGYERKFHRHSFKTLLGYQQESKSFESLSGSNQNLYSVDLPSLSLTYGTNFSANDDLYRWVTEGYFFRFNYNFGEKYLLEFNGRYDGASLFRKENRYNFFPSISVGYNISAEEFWSPLSGVINNFKLRASYGSLGDITSLIDAGNYYFSQSVLSNAAPTGTNYIFGDTRQPYVRAGGLVSPEVSWAKPAMLDIGLDMSVLKDRLQITFDWYRRRTKDLFGPPQQYSGVLGVNPPQKNNSAIETKGFDLTASWRDNAGPVSYNIRFVLSDYKGTVLDYPNNLVTGWYPGQNMGDIWGYKTVGFFQTDDEIKEAALQTRISSVWFPGDMRYADLNNDGVINVGNLTLDSSGDVTVLGNNTPRFNYGLTLGAEWRGFDLSVFVQGIGKREYFTNSNYFWGIVGDPYQSSPLATNLDRWTPETPNGYFPRYYLNSQMRKNIQTQSRYILNSAYLRLKNLQIGYSLPAAFTKRMMIRRLRVYLSAENVFTLSPGLHKKFQVDPELLIGNLKIYPIQRTLSIGVNLTL